MTYPPTEPSASAPEILDAEAVDSALGARWSGVDHAAVAAAFGDEAARLADLAGYLMAEQPRAVPAADLGFVAALESRLVAAYESRQARRLRVPALGAFGGVRELLVAGALATAIAVGAFLYGAGSLANGDPTAVPTVSAAGTTTLTVPPATPEARATSAIRRLTLLGVAPTGVTKH